MPPARDVLQQHINTKAEDQVQVGISAKSLLGCVKLLSCCMQWLGLYLFQLDLRVDMDVTDLAVEGFVLQAGALQSRGTAVLELSSRSRVGLDRPGAAPGLQHRLVLRTCEE